MIKNMQSVTYSDKRVPVHGTSYARVVLINEAPGPDEDLSGIPCFGQQGGNIYRTLCLAGIDWAQQTQTFSWPIKSPEGRTKGYQTRCGLKDDFLRQRARQLLITNAFPSWPRPADGGKNFCRPRDEDVLSLKNQKRLEEEISGERHILLIGGEMAYLACTGERLKDSSTFENKSLLCNVLDTVNERLKTSFKLGWYLGHTRRWSIHQGETTKTFECIAGVAGWSRTTQ